MRLADLLSGSVPADLLGRFTGRYEVIGSVAIVTIPPGLEEYKTLVAKKIIAARRNVYTVLARVHKAGSDDRIPLYEVLAGGTTVTRYREFGYQYRFDVAKVFFSSRMAGERMRVAEQVEPGEQVLVPFCGAGPFVIPAAARGAQVVAVEKNPDAFGWLRENIAANHVQKNVTAIPGDAWDTGLLHGTRFDRIIIPTPYGMDAIFDVLAPFAGKEGMIHFYTFRPKNEIPAVARAFAEKGFGTTYCNACGNVAPGISRWVFDLVPASRG